LGWGQALRAWAVFEPSVATPSADAAFAARRFADLAGARSTPDARRVRALALARYADLAPDGAAAARARADAARAFIEAGDRAAARAVLERVAQDSNASPDAQRFAQRAVVEAMIEGGQRDEAAQQLATNARLSTDDRASLRLGLARARIVAGELDRADAELGRDSSVEALALQGWIALYRGRLSDARRLFLAAGPYAGDRRDATARAAMVALLQQLPGDSFPALGGVPPRVWQRERVAVGGPTSCCWPRVWRPGWTPRNRAPRWRCSTRLSAARGWARRRPPPSSSGRGCSNAGRRRRRRSGISST
jgi:hypothetical protein